MSDPEYRDIPEPQDEVEEEALPTFKWIVGGAGFVTPPVVPAPASPDSALMQSTPE